MPNTRRKYDEDFKRRAVRLSYGSGRTVTSAADGLGIHASLLHRWRKIFTPEGDHTKSAEQLSELRALRGRVAELEEENDLLKKASAYFAVHQRK
jgi:transposase